MTFLLGAWSLSERLVDRGLLSDASRAVEAAGGGRGEPIEALAGRLWLHAPSGRVFRRNDRLVAWEGFLAPGSRAEDLLPRLEGREGLAPDAGPSGDCVAVGVDLSSATLWLLRDPSGGERLYFRVREGSLLFSTSLRALLLSGAQNGVPALELETAYERAAEDIVHFGDQTVVAGVREVLAGHRLTAAAGAPPSQAWAWGGLLTPLDGDAEELAPGLAARMEDAVARCIGRDGRVAVALSGGIDSAFVTSIAAKLVGPDNVHAFTYEYQDPEHPSEVPYAAAVCRALGIRSHRVVPVSFDRFMETLVDAVWLAEDPAFWRRSYAVIVADAARAAGFDRFLTGFGIGSHMAYLEDVALVAQTLPFPGWALRHWNGWREFVHGENARWSVLHPGLAPPYFRLYYPILCALRHRGILGGLEPFFPRPVDEWVERTVRAPRVRDSLRSTDALPLARQMQFHSFVSLNSCVDVARCGRLSRLVGASWLGPAHFPACLPYAYFPTRTAPALWSRRRRGRPGKDLVRHAIRGRVPDEVLNRKKYWRIFSVAWQERALERMARAAGPSLGYVRDFLAPTGLTSPALDRPTVVALAFWRRVFLERLRGPRPAWNELL